MRKPVRTWWGGGLLAVASAAAATLARQALDPFWPPGFPYLTFFPAVILTTFVAGLWPGILCAVLSGLAAWWFFIPPAGFGLTSGGALTLVFFAGVVAVDIALIHGMRTALDRLNHQFVLNAELYRKQRLLFQELQHRVANNMTFVASVLSLGRRRIRDPEAAGVLDDAHERLIALAQIHRRLYDPAAVDMPIEGYLRALCEDLTRVALDGRVVCRVSAASDLRLDLDKLVALSLLVTELVTNSLKHAFADREAGSIDVEITRQNGRVALVIRDDGPGFPPAGRETNGGGLGQAIIRSLAAQLNAEVLHESGPGAVTRIAFAA